MATQTTCTILAVASVCIIVALLYIAFAYQNFAPYSLNYYSSHIDPLTKNKISVVLLNYNRPKNLIINLPHLNKMDIIGEIIVSHGLEKNAIHFNHSKVRNFLDYTNNSNIGPAIRFIRGLDAVHDVVLFMDDDVRHNEDMIHETYQALMRTYERNTLYGCVHRRCDQRGYGMNGRGAVLTPFLMMKKKVLVDFMTYGFDRFVDWFVANHGNCEDLSINVFVHRYYNETAVTIPDRGRFKYIDKLRGISYKPGHRAKRNQFCRTHQNMTF